MRSKSSKRLYRVFVLFVSIYLFFKLSQLISQSLFFNTPDRINILIYGPETYYYSLDQANNRDYVISFQPDLKVDVPGGYGTYAVGSLGKLALLDNNPQLIQNTFALATSTFVHFIFFDEIDEVYYGSEIPPIQKPSLQKILFGSSNAGLLDRLYLVVILFGDKDDTYRPITFIEQREEVFNEVSFENELFFKDSIGLLFQKRYRDEHESIQILYPGKYTTALRVSDLLEGNGIRVSDISYDIHQSKDCEVIYSAEHISYTASDIAWYFGCLAKPGKTDVYDILFILGEVEKQWNVN